MSTKVKRFSLAAVALSASVVIGVGATATASPKSHEIHFISVTISESLAPAGSFYQSIVDVASQKTLFDGVVSCGPEVEAQCDAAAADASGILDVHFTITSAGVLSGTVTGGTGAYANATGTVSGREVNGGEGVTVVYTT
jgi:hypothetical protein